MLIFAWVVFGLSALTLLFVIINIFINFSSARLMISGIVPLTLWIVGCLWYIFSFTLLPYELIIGIALGAAVFYSLTLIVVMMERFSIDLSTLTTFAALVFFSLATVMSIWPNLLPF